MVKIQKLIPPLKVIRRKKHDQNAAAERFGRISTTASGKTFGLSNGAGTPSPDDWEEAPLFPI
jgi:hypothetical protein